MTTIPGPITLTWRGTELYAGKMYCGQIVNVTPFEESAYWLAKIAVRGGGEIVDASATEPEARAALVAVVEKALKGNEDG